MYNWYFCVFFSKVANICLYLAVKQLFERKTNCDLGFEIQSGEEETAKDLVKAHKAWRDASVSTCPVTRNW